MQPIRQIYYDAPSTIEIPVELQHKTVEVIFWPLDKTESQQQPQTDANGWPLGFFAATAGCLAANQIERAPQGDTVY